ncbi:MAG: ABC transporter substrate-binding protein [Treponema sp.]|jgi:putative spermidine/putrescine transport system substrate-binding protein|nr:ABC transporter substrate-binding protein [Treponema sp.]
MLRRIFVMAGLAALIGVSVFAKGGSEQKAPDSGGTAGPSFKGQTLTISHWGYNMDLLEKNIFKPFEEKYGAKIVYETGNNADRFTKLMARKDNPIVDAAFFAGNYGYDAVNAGLLEPYNPAKIGNLNKILASARDPLGGNYMIGYSVSHLGLFYRSDKTAPITSWKDLYRPELKGFLSLPNMNTTFGPGLVYMLAKAYGGSTSNTEVGWAKLEELAPYLANTYANSAGLNSMIQQEEVYAAPYTSFSWGDIEKMGLKSASAVPAEGLVGAFSVVGIVKGSKNTELAHVFIDFLLSYEVQLAEAMDLVDSPVHTDVKLPPDVAGKLTYGEDLIKNLFFYSEAEVAKNKADWIARWNKIFSK